MIEMGVVIENNLHYITVGSCLSEFLFSGKSYPADIVELMISFPLLTTSQFDLRKLI